MNLVYILLLLGLSAEIISTAMILTVVGVILSTVNH